MTQIQHYLFQHLSKSLGTWPLYFCSPERQATVELASFRSHHCTTCAKRGDRWKVRLEFVNAEDDRKFRTALKGAEKIDKMFDTFNPVWSRSPNLLLPSLPRLSRFYHMPRKLWGNTGLLAAAILVQMAYGGIHLTAWHSNFPSHAETWTWRTSCIMVAAFTPFLAGVCLPLKLMIDSIEKPQRRDQHPHADDNVGPTYLEMLLFFAVLVAPPLAVVMLTPAMLAARVFLVIESFLSLRAVPIGVYAAVPWSSYIPHF
jgi:hypothetical protein